jgi:16S rRNA (guanine966-N2)-methyltransferase
MGVGERLETRVGSGALKGRRLVYPRDPELRPTMQRTRMSVFESIGDGIRNAVFVDLYAAAGGMGIEALSRGAARAHFVERSAEAIRCLERNLERCGIGPERGIVHRRAVIEFLRSGGLREIAPDFVYADPPYRSDEPRLLLEFFNSVEYPLKILFLVEHQKDVLSLESYERLTVLKTRDFGQSRVSFVLLKGDGP